MFNHNDTPCDLQMLKKTCNDQAMKSTEELKRKSLWLVYSVLKKNNQHISLYTFEKKKVL